MSRSAVRSPPSPPPRDRAKTTSAAEPATAAQNPRAHAFVCAQHCDQGRGEGMNAARMATWADVVRSRASASRMGHPKTAPTS